MNDKEKIIELIALVEEERKAKLQWADRYNREVFGVNNEGDPIGGNPPQGLKYRVEYLSERMSQLSEALREIIAISDRKHDAWDKAKLLISETSDTQNLQRVPEYMFRNLADGLMMVIPEQELLRFFSADTLEKARAILAAAPSPKEKP